MAGSASLVASLVWFSCPSMPDLEPLDECLDRLAVDKHSKIVLTNFPNEGARVLHHRDGRSHGLFMVEGMRQFADGIRCGSEPRLITFRLVNERRSEEESGRACTFWPCNEFESIDVVLAHCPSKLLIVFVE